MSSVTIYICWKFVLPLLCLKHSSNPSLLQSRSHSLQCQSYLNSRTSLPHLLLSYCSDFLGKALCLCGLLLQTTLPPDVYTAYSFFSSRFLLQHQTLKEAYFNMPTENCNPSTYTSNSPHSELFFLWYLSSDVQRNLFIYHAYFFLPVFPH